MPTSGKNFKVIPIIAFEILGGMQTPPDAIKLSAKTYAIKC